MNNNSISRLLLLCLFVVIASLVHANEDETTKYVSDEFVKQVSDSKSQQELSPLTEQDATDIAALLDKARNDEETKKMVLKLKIENRNDVMDLQRELSHDDIQYAMKVTLDEIKMLDYLFKNPERAVTEMENEGLIPNKRKLKEYKKNPKLLEEDTRKGLYFQFVTLAVAGDYY